MEGIAWSGVCRGMCGIDGVCRGCERGAASSAVVMRRWTAFEHAAVATAATRKTPTTKSSPPPSAAAQSLLLLPVTPRGRRSFACERKSNN